jgi:sugar phosphate isomerase/epimerase
MDKNLSPAALGISGRHTELVEICLTHRFRGFDVDIGELVRRAESGGVEYAVRYLAAAPIKIGGWQLPLDIDAPDSDFQIQLSKLSLPIQVAEALRANRCFLSLPANSVEHPFHENFLRIAQRVTKVAEVLATKEMRLGLAFHAAPGLRDASQYQFIQQAEAACQLIDAARAENVGLLLDAWDWHVGGGTLERLRELGSKRLVAVRLSDLPADADLKTIGEEQRLLPATGGGIDSASIVSLLIEQGYDGPVSVGCHPSQHAGQKREAIIASASTVLDTLFAAAVA